MTSKERDREGISEQEVISWNRHFKIKCNINNLGMDYLYMKFHLLIRLQQQK